MARVAHVDSESRVRISFSTLPSVNPRIAANRQKPSTKEVSDTWLRVLGGDNLRSELDQVVTRCHKHRFLDVDFRCNRQEKTSTRPSCISRDEVVIIFGAKVPCAFCIVLNGNSSLFSAYRIELNPTWERRERACRQRVRFHIGGFHGVGRDGEVPV